MRIRPLGTEDLDGGVEGFSIEIFSDCIFQQFGVSGMVFQVLVGLASSQVKLIISRSKSY